MDRTGSGKIFSFRILEFRVVRFISRFAAAVAITPFASCRACRMISRSDAARVWTLSSGATGDFRLVELARSPRKTNL